MNYSNQKIPNLFVIGAMKSGTTSLHRYLGTHPEIFMSQGGLKETHYFVKELNWSRGKDWYLNIFKSAGDAKVIGESCIDYSKLPRYQGVPERIASFNPEGRIVYIMRDPVERSISHYWWDVRWSGEGRNMLTAIQKVRDITDVSYYAMQLRPYIDIFGRDRIFAMTTEELSLNPRETLAKLFKWLGIDPSFVPDNLNRRYNVSSEEVPTVRGARLFSQLRGTPVWESIKKLIPASSRNMVRDALARPMKRDLTYVNETIEYLRPIQQQQTAELCDLLGRQFPEWQTLYGTQAELSELNN